MSGTTRGPFSLDGKVAVVTGSTSGIGAATAAALARAGAVVVVVGRRADRGQAVVARIRDAGFVAEYAQVDVRDVEAIDEMVAGILDRHGNLDLAFNSVGIFDRRHELHTYDDTAWDEMIAINLSAVFRCMRAEIAAMLETGGGAIVNNASTVSHRGSDRAGPAYVAAKHGVIGLTRQAAVQYADRGIRVNAVSPGPTDTELAEPLIAEGPAAVRAALIDLNPRARFVRAEEVAAAVVYLCSDGATMINGHDIAIDGGQLAKL